MKSTVTAMICCTICAALLPRAVAQENMGPGLSHTPPGTAPTTTAPATVQALPAVQVDVKARKIRVECEALNPRIPLEFFCVMNGTSEHESVLRSAAKASHIHLALLMLGCKPGAPAHYDEATKTWLPPTGAPLQISVEYEKDGKVQSFPANRLMRGVKDKSEAPPFIWVFDGSRVMPDGVYATDVTGYLVSIVNFDLTTIDVPKLASNANETLEWEYNPQLVPPVGTKVWMIIQPAEKK